VTVWDWRRAEALTTIPTFAESMAFDPSSTFLATADPAGSASIWEVPSGQLRTTLEGHSAGVSDVVFSPDGARVATGSHDGTVRLWDPTTGVSRLTLGADQGPVWTVRFSPDGSRLASTHSGDLVRVWALDLDDLIAIAQEGLTRGLTHAECRQYLHVDSCDASAS
jgi:WD40 repeat protein